MQKGADGHTNMCGRFNLYEPPRIWLRRIGVEVGEDDLWTPEYNIAPTQMIPVLRQGGDDLELVRMQWGFVPWWTEGKPETRPINARAEKVFSSPMWRDAMEHRRCLIPATGFYEWKREGNVKQPYHVYIKGHKPFLFAGRWDTWHSPKGDIDIDTVAIITTTANRTLRPIHDRMPVIIPLERARDWFERPDEALLTPLNDSELVAERISRRINNVRNKGADALQAVAADQVR